MGVDQKTPEGYAAQVYNIKVSVRNLGCIRVIVGYITQHEVGRLIASRVKEYAGQTIVDV